MPISQLTLPNVTVCPPKNSLLDLNYDIVHSDEYYLDNNTRIELIEYALGVIQEEFYHEVMKNMSKLDDPAKFYNWYHGFTWVNFPFYYYGLYNQLRYFVYTSATSGNITTNNFGEKFDAQKIDVNIYISIRVYSSKTVRSDKRSSLMFNIEKNTIQEDSDNDRIDFGTVGYLDAGETNFSKTFFPPQNETKIVLDRKVSTDTIRNFNTSMPGFRLIWKYDRDVNDYRRSANSKSNKQYIRYLF